MNVLPSSGWQGGLRTALLPGWHGMQSFPLLAQHGALGRA